MTLSSIAPPTSALSSPGSGDYVNNKRAMIDEDTYITTLTEAFSPFAI